ncbi:MAG: NusG domain II-containing protein [Pseudomonadota bacterium]|nr:NusG domain II-containing protein [Gammaproteobacteria bacterium]MBU1731708.1 NusG domain II-containing protein [Gammaproteobacteria bacterium]MBU1892532.1 NusG domain II-containing protein [Gammaproteobacteria bacterium]
MNLGFKTGDWLTVLAGMLLIIYLFLTLWGGDRGTSLIIRSGGKIVTETDLTRNRDFEISGPLGTTLVTVNNHRVRVARDPSPRQYCVQQGWLSRAGEAALCLPNQVSVELLGAARSYDSLSY